jgi:hypothetical protein
MNSGIAAYMAALPNFDKYMGLAKTVELGSAPANTVFRRCCICNTHRGTLMKYDNEKFICQTCKKKQ